MNESQTLLRRYVQDGSEAAFEELVKRYINLVYASAVRLLDGDIHAAKDVSQIVFVDLAHKAPTLSEQGRVFCATLLVKVSVSAPLARREQRTTIATSRNGFGDGFLFDDASLRAGGALALRRKLCRTLCPCLLPKSNRIRVHWRAFVRVKKGD